MPIIDVECKKCGKFEILLLSKEDKLVCEICGGEVTKLMSPSNAHFKGSGFYKTDYSNKKNESKKDS